MPSFQFDMERLRIALLFLTVWLFTASMSFGFPCKEVERNALLHFKSSFSKPSDRFYSWVGQDCCNWKGVGCDNVTSNIISLDLRADQSFYEVVATKVNPSLLELKYLRYLDLSGIDFNHSRIPTFFGSMRQLHYLNLSYGDFVGMVPHTLGNLTKLRVLDLGWNSDMGTNNLEWTYKLESLQYIDLNYVNLSQALNSLHILDKLPSLLVLKLSDCELGNSHGIMRNSTVASHTLQHLDLSFNLFSDQIPLFIQNLSFIQYLDLSSNQFNSSVPSWLGNKIELRYLSLANNNFKGPFPGFIQNLSFVTSLDLSFNQFSSSIPSWLANKTYLVSLDFTCNQFDRVSGGVMIIMGRLCLLENMDFSDNLLKEELLESYANYSMCSKYNLESLYLDNNSISGHFPMIGSFSSLVYLYLSNNQLQNFPLSLTKLPSLIHLDLSYNNLRGVHQVNSKNLPNLVVLDLSFNSLTLNLSSDSTSPFQLEYLNLTSCKLNIPFPNWLLSQENIDILDLSNTGLIGPLPYNIGYAMLSLLDLQLANNQINGSIPRSLCKPLMFLDLQKNELSGEIPDCLLNSHLHHLHLSSNRLFGSIPNVQATNYFLQVLSLSNNSLDGDLPLSLWNCNRLQLLDVSKNNLHGKIPPWNGTTDGFTYVHVLILRENKFKGVIPPQLCSIKTLQILDLAQNNLVGTIPPCFGHFGQRPYGYFDMPLNTGVYSLPLGWSAMEFIKGEEREYDTILQWLVSIDLSSNVLEGVIPDEFTNISFLVNLNLSRNHLTGFIPMDIGNVKYLESLDLSYNNISGPIPTSLSSLTFLSTMNLSYNKLQGQIPTGNQLQTLNDPSIYTGNLGLCGDPLPKKCYKDGVLAHPPTSTTVEDEEEDKRERMWFYLVVMFGFATGFWGVILVLVVKKRWRLAYFRLAEELADWLYVTIAVTIARAKGGR